MESWKLQITTCVFLETAKNDFTDCGRMGKVSNSSMSSSVRVSQLLDDFLAPTGAQGVKMSVRPCVRACVTFLKKTLKMSFRDLKHV